MMNIGEATPEHLHAPFFRLINFSSKARHTPSCVAAFFVVCLQEESAGKLSG
jgi:hypothetical protein